MPAKEPSLRARALRHLARREHTRHELALKLAPHAGSEAEVAQILDDFTQRGWLSEQRAAEQIVHARRGRYGPARIRRDLEAKGVSAEASAAALATLKDGELEAARAVWKRKFRAPPANAAERARQARFLLGRGFGSETIVRLLRGLSRDGMNGVGEE
ncbi:MAG: recombination regulator RecX [Burkholderiales bacterium]|nr:recombination regulator RecX [Burkholderiales bacterium]